jgi:hypothetical protein
VFAPESPDALFAMLGNKRLEDVPIGALRLRSECQPFWRGIVEFLGMGVAPAFFEAL